MVVEDGGAEPMGERERPGMGWNARDRHIAISCFA